MKKYLLIAFLLISFIPFAQESGCNLIFAGQVIDQHDSTAVPFAKIQIKEANLSITTDSIGQFKFSGLCAGEYTIVCLHHIGCEPVKFKRTFNSRAE